MNAFNYKFVFPFYFVQQCPSPGIEFGIIINIRKKMSYCFRKGMNKKRVVKTAGSTCKTSGIDKNKSN